MVRYVFAIFNIYISTMADGRGYLMEDIMVGYIIAIVNVYISELARRCRGPSLADLSSTFPPPSRSFILLALPRPLPLDSRGHITTYTSPIPPAILPQANHIQHHTQHPSLHTSTPKHNVLPRASRSPYLGPE